MYVIKYEANKGIVVVVVAQLIPVWIRVKSLDHTG